MPSPTKAFVTGAGGFVGGHLLAELRAHDLDVVAPPHDELDLRDADAVARAIAAAEPDAVFHLAALASVGQSWSEPGTTIAENVATTQNVLDAVRAGAPEAVVLVSGSGEEYGPVPEDRLPVVESEELRPQNPYAVSKAMAGLLAGFYADAHGLRVIRTRAFNHAGPGQTDAYVVSAFARQIAEAEAAGRPELVLRTGNLAPRRDFTDVRDVVRAYRVLVERGEPGVFNVCRGESFPVADILARLAGFTGLRVEQEVDPARLRKHEVMDIRGSHDKLTQATGWQPDTPLDRTLADALDAWRAALA